VRDPVLLCSSNRLENDVEKGDSVVSSHAIGLKALAKR
jgi:hypothetical protein